MDCIITNVDNLIYIVYEKYYMCGISTICSYHVGVKQPIITGFVQCCQLSDFVS